METTGHATHSAIKRRRFTPAGVGQAIWSVIRLILIIGIGFIILHPVLVKLSASFMNPKDLWDNTVKWIPRNFTLDNYRIAFTYMYYPKAFVRSVSLAAVVSVLQLLTCTSVGYALARFQFRGNGLLFALVVFTLIVPPQLILIPMYLNFRFFNIFGLLPGSGINLIGTYWPAILMACGAVGLRNGIFIYIMRQFFKGMPQQLEEAAYVDGANPYRTFVSVMMPSAVPAMVTVFLFSFVWQWNDVFYTSIFMQDSDLLPFTLKSVGMQYDIAYGQMTGGGHITNQEWVLIENTGMLLFIAPLLILYAVLQRYFIESVERTGIVG